MNDDITKYSPFVVSDKIDDDGAMLITHSNKMYYAYLVLVEIQKIRSGAYYMIPFWNVFRKISWSIKTKQSTKKLHENYIKYEYGRRIVYAYCKKYGFDVIDIDNHTKESEMMKIESCEYRECIYYVQDIFEITDIVFVCRKCKHFHEDRYVSIHSQPHTP